MFHEFPCTTGVSHAQAFNEAFEQVDAAERWGLDVMWLAELHAAPTRSVLAAPLTIAAAIATRTKRMKIGTAVQVLPLCHPLRLAEEAATVDQLSHGRLIFGVGRSDFPRTYQAYGIRMRRARSGLPRRWILSSRRGVSRRCHIRENTTASTTCL